MPKPTTAVPRIRAKTPIGLLKAVVRIIREEPRRYYQNAWVRTDGIYVGSPQKMAPPCGTVCCVAGWIAVGTRDKGESVQDIKRTACRFFCDSPVSRRARVALNISSSQADRLFDGSAIRLQWEHEGRDETKVPKPGTKAYVETGIRHIERFMRNELGYTGPKL